MATKKKSASQIAAEQEYYRLHNIVVPQKEEKNVAVKSDRPVNKINEPLSGDANLKEFGEYIETINKCAPMVNMTDKQIVPLLIERYETVLKIIIKPDFITDTDRVLKMLTIHDCHRGICFLSRKVFGVIVNDRDWIKENTTGNKVYWWEIPVNCRTAREMVDSVSFRLDRLTDVLNSLV